ncbi:MAG TPA: HNH endonuclease signature motif containing protein [Candidatus Krumholzibacteria bacterium]|nr:HNH endonuclease signature motif containing protein [Candidatus Krumholzibacteria bacterium]
MLLSLRSLSDSDLLFRVRDLTVRERTLTLLLLLHLNEVERRKLHLKQGYSSMFDYCTSGLGYSEPAAVRRIRTARCIARIPEVYGLLESNQVNLSTIARVSRVLTAGNKDALLERIRERTQREVDAIVAEYQPRAAIRDVIKPVVVRVPAATVSGALGASASVAVPGAPGLAIESGALGRDASTDSKTSVNATVEAPADDCEKNAYRRCDGASHPPDCVRSAETFVTEKRIQFQFAASETFQVKLEKVKSLAWHRLPPNPSLEHLFELALDALIERHDPGARQERRQRHQEAAGATLPQRVKREAARAGRVGHRGSGTRYVATAMRDTVFARDGSRCPFVGPNGKRCGSRSALQIDHIKPVARGGASTLDNLRLLCAYHNRLEAERLMGPLARSRPRLRE